MFGLGPIELIILLVMVLPVVVIIIVLRAVGKNAKNKQLAAHRHCSNCGESFPGSSNFCPNCGAEV